MQNVVNCDNDRPNESEFV